MTNTVDPGLGELLRHLVELTDGTTDRWYREQGFNYRPRYTPIMRALLSGPASVTDIQEKLSVTQGAVSQTLRLMLEDDLIVKKRGDDARQSIVSLTAHGQALLQKLKPHWEATFAAIESLEQEIQFPLRKCLSRSVDALERKSFADRINISEPRPSIAPEQKLESNPFHRGGERYAQFRPSYPPELAQSLSALATNKALAVDVGCGNGQLSSLLAPYFNEVVGIDPSESQLIHAEATNNMTYLACTAEDICLPDDSVDLVVVAQAAHWFDLDRFYTEARRIARQDAALALVSYGVPYISDPVNALFQKGYWQDVHEFWSAERKNVETGYADLFFPFPLIKFPSCSCRAEMTVDQFINYITTWSAYKNARKDGFEGRFDSFFDVLRGTWAKNEIKEVVWPISVKAARVHPSAE